MVDVLVYDNKQMKDSKMKCINPLLPQPTKGAFRWVLLGPSGSGKSTLIKNVMFNDAWGYNKYFDEIYAFIGSLDDVIDLKTEVIKRDLTDQIAVQQKFVNSDVQNLFEEIEVDNSKSKEKTRVLFIFDDQVTNGLTNKGKTNIIDTLYVRGRHALCSIIVSTQKYKLLNNNVRQLNLSYLTIYEGTNSTDLEAVSEEHNGTKTPKSFLSRLRTQLVNQYDTVTLDYNRQGMLLDTKFKPLAFAAPL